MKGVIVNQVKHVNSERQENNLLKLYTLDLTHKILKTLTSHSLNFQKLVFLGKVSG